MTMTRALLLACCLASGCFPSFEERECFATSECIGDRVCRMGRCVENPDASSPGIDASEADAALDAQSADTGALDTGPDSGPDSGPDGGCWALAFEQPTDVVLEPEPIYETFAGDLIIEAWVRIDHVPTSTETIIAWPDLASDRSAFELDLTAGGHVRFCTYSRYYDNQSPPQLVSETLCTPFRPTVTSTIVQPGVWTHVAATHYSTPENSRVFVNGYEDSNYFGGDDVASSLNPLAVGNAPNLAGRGVFVGEVAELRINQQTPLDYMNLETGAPFRPATSFAPDLGTILLWQLDEGMEMMANDISGHDKTGRINGPKWVPGGPPCE